MGDIYLELPPSQVELVGLKRPSIRLLDFIFISLLKKDLQLVLMISFLSLSLFDCTWVFLVKP